MASKLLRDPSLKNEGIVKVYFGNIQGTSGGSKLPLLRSRTDDCDIIHLSETNKRPEDEGSIKLGCGFGRVSKTPNPDRTGPGFGSFLGLKTMEPNAGDKLWVHDHFEISGCTRVFNGCKLTVIGVYRSPSMGNEEIDKFYDELDVIATREVSESDIVIMGGDDNSHDEAKSCAKARKAFLRLEGIRNKLCGVHVVDQPTHGNHQTDHVIAFHDMLRFNIGAIVCPGVGDHCEMHIKIQGEDLIDDKPWFQKRKVVVDHGVFEVVATHLSAALNGFTFELIDSMKCINQSVLDDLLEAWDRIVEGVRVYERKTITRSFPTKPGPLKCKEQREVQFCKNKLAVLYPKLNKSNLSALEKATVKTDIQLWIGKYEKACRAAGWAILRKDMSQMRKFSKVNPARYFQGTGYHMKSDQIDVAYSDEELAQKLIKAEENYYLKGPPLQRSDFDDIESDAQFEIPFDIETTLTEIAGLKKVDTFYKTYKKVLAPSLAAIAYAMSLSMKFPSNCKILKLCFLKSRTIFSADFMTKFLESLVLKGLDEVLPPETLGQFAYEPGRSTVLCVAFGLNEIDKMPDLGFGWAADQMKAFDSARWATICQVMQKEAGAGEFIFQYFTDRNYRYKNELGFKSEPQGRGTMPGSRVGPKLFSKFQSSNISCTFKNDTWKAPGAFSDDILSVTEWQELLNGRVQQSIDECWKWSQENFVSYHLTGKKAPEYFVFRKKGDVSSPILPQPITLGVTEITRKYEVTQLGVNIKLFKDDEVANDHGYVLDWRSKKTEFSRMAYRLQDIRDYFNPEMRWKTCRTYIAGKIQYASALYWLRSTQDNIDNVRYFYAMSLAGIMGMSTPEVVTMRSCKEQKIKADNKGFLSAVKLLNMPTLKDLAIEGSKSLLRQWSEWRPSQFTFDIEGNVTGTAAGEDKLLGDLYKLSKEERNDWYPTFNQVKGRDRRTTVFKQDEIPLWQTFWSVMKTSFGESNLPDEEFDRTANGVFLLMCRDHFKALEPVTRVKKRLDPVISVATIRSRDEVSNSVATVGPNPRPKKRRIDLDDDVIIDDPEPAAASRKRQRPTDDANPDYQAPPERKRRLTKDKPKMLERLHCGVPLPKVRGRKTNPCRICGYAIGKQKVKDKKAGIPFSVKFSCCDSNAHIECWTAASVISQDINCVSLQWLLKKDRATAVRVVDENEVVRQESTDHALCEFCGKLINLRDAKSNHLADECSVLAEFRSNLDPNADPIRKLADKCLWLVCAKLNLKIPERDDCNGNTGGRTGPVGTSDRRTNAADSQVT